MLAQKLELLAGIYNPSFDSPTKIHSQQNFKSYSADEFAITESHQPAESTPRNSSRSALESRVEAMENQFVSNFCLNCFVEYFENCLTEGVVKSNRNFQQRFGCLANRESKAI
jgi:hypothetical protein